MCKVYTDVGGIKWLFYGLSPEREIIHSLKPVDYLHVQTDKQLYNHNIDNKKNNNIELFVPKTGSRMSTLVA